MCFRTRVGKPFHKVFPVCSSLPHTAYFLYSGSTIPSSTASQYTGKGEEALLTGYTSSQKAKEQWEE